MPSAIHAMGRAIAKISDLQTPSDPKTTFTVGTVSGGTSVNAIAGEARMAVDMRSNSTEELLKLEARLLDLVKEAVAEENARWKSDKMTVEIKLIGDRPAGIVAMDSPIVQATQRAVSAVTRGPRVDLCRLQDRFQPRHVARHSGRHHRRRRRGRQLAFAQRMVQAGRRLVRPAERAADGVDAGGNGGRQRAGPAAARGEVGAAH